jgi:hypothetical protein
MAPRDIIPFKSDENEHHILANWAADCAEHVLYLFEENHNDSRPREAIEGVRAWIRGEIEMTESRKLAFDAHAAARSATCIEAISAARAAGHAAATAHVQKHAKHAADYAL